MKEFWEDRYKNNDYFYGEDPNHFLKSVSGILHPHSNILCLGEGEGRNAVFLSKLGHKVSAIDFSFEGQKKTQKLAQKFNVDVSYMVSDLEEYNFETEKWDAIVSIFCHLPSDPRSMIHHKVYDSLKFAGKLILLAYNPRQLQYNTGGPKDIQMLYTESLIKNDFPKLTWARLDESITELHEGNGHNGPSAVLSAIGVK